jgi:glycolate oxidase FAD binding subunit
MSEKAMHARPPWLASLSGLLDAGQIDTDPAHLQAHAVDGRVPSAIAFPEDFTQTAAVLQWAQTEKLAVLPRGSGSEVALGGIPRRADLILSTGRLRRIGEYDAANFTLTAQAGVSFAAAAHLAAGNLQTLPLQYPSSPTTLGGLIATNAANPKRLLYGGVRDLLLGLRVALPSGAVVHFGGKVVKNVAGYDMSKLFVGSLGALGIIVEATFKLYALPERDETVWAGFPTWPQAAEAAAQLLAAPLLPSQVLLLNAAAAQALMPEEKATGGVKSAAANTTTGGATLLVNVEGMDEAVERQLRDAARICRGQGAATVDVVTGERQDRLRQRLTAAAQAGDLADVGEGRSGGAISVRLGTLPSRVPAVMEAVAHATNAVTPPLIVGDCGGGQVRLILRGEDLAFSAGDEVLVQVLRDLPRLVAVGGGYVVIEAAPTAVKERLDVWGPPPSAFNLLKALKAKFDPAGVLNPGRFIGGL